MLLLLACFTGGTVALASALLLLSAPAACGKSRTFESSGSGSSSGSALALKLTTALARSSALALVVVKGLTGNGKDKPPRSAACCRGFSVVNAPAPLKASSG
jgi:hypothetical protein